MFRTIEKEIINQTLAKKEKLVETTYEEALEVFHKKWGEYPTEEEKKLLKEKINQAFND
jgi:hypothetical protein